MATRWARPLYLMAKPPGARLPELGGVRARLGIESDYALERAHVTLLPLGESMPRTIDAVHRALRDFDAQPFALAFDHVEGNTLKPSKGQRAPGIFQRALACRIAASGVRLPDYEFAAHLNLAYGARSDRRAAIPPFSWLVEEIVLIESVHGQGRHLARGLWRLAARQFSLDL